MSKPNTTLPQSTVAEKSRPATLVSESVRPQMTRANRGAGASPEKPCKCGEKG